MSDPDSVANLLASMRRTLMFMEAAGIPKERLAEVLELALQELKAEIARGKSGAH